MTIEEIVAECERQGFIVKQNNLGIYRITLAPKNVPYRKMRDMKRKELQKCVRCGGDTDGEHSLCFHCRTKDAETNKQRYHSQREKGLCAYNYCTQAPEPNKLYCAKHLAYYRKRTQEYQERKKVLDTTETS